MDRPIIPAPAPLPPPAWTAIQRVLFRFFFAYLLLYIFFNPNALGIGPLYNIYIPPFRRLIPWIATHILHLSGPVGYVITGSGDTAYENVTYLFLLLLALVTCLAWSVLDRRRQSYRTAFYWLTAIVRYYVGITMVAYGFAKVFKVQMPSPDLMRLLEPFGDSSPFALAWTYMGYSAGYSMFAGLAEVVAGVLLFFRRTTAIGAFLSFVISANIMAMNYSFDIPVKLLATTLLVMSLFLLGENIHRLWALFFQNRIISLNIVARPRIRKNGARMAMGIAKCVTLAWFLIIPVIRYVTILTRYGDRAPRTPLRGIYNVRAFIWDHDMLPALQSDSIRWKQLIIDGIVQSPYVGIKMMDDSVSRYSAKIDTNSQTLTITTPNDTARNWQLSYAYRAGDSLLLWGRQIRGAFTDSIHVTLVRYPLTNFPLNSRGFHWINEFPYNR